MKYILIPIFIFSSLGFASCSVDLNSKSPGSNYLDRVTASENTITQKRTLSSFEGIDVSSAIAVTVNDGDYDGAITIEAPDNIMDKIVTEVNNGVLKISIKGTVNLNNSQIKVNFPHKKLRSFSISGASNVKVIPTLKVDQLAIDLSGASNLKLDVVSNQIAVDNSGASSMKISGNVQDLAISVSGASSLIAKDLKAANVVVDCSGASSTTVWAIDKLTADSSGASSVKYVDESGLVVKVETSGMSSVKKISK
ncbi:Putative auto-transporter adhesin, head GIN domain [Algoriella xinjiangensis]|uniref:Putative auto-transporter adhesin, head GIN domain n=1 Tax=Algoriella xinjiangensis TaxID=684065 RepID=A0A1I4UT79_9FLAO|nr:head GIN domain-containing protein [Algoriella xinjiangensis]SFM92174.1 Putative auto-transporter adhesin, head GIN domain [Algoriella xinjiangensis]